MIPTKAASAMLWKNTQRKMSPSCPYHSVAVLATTMLCASIILPITPPQQFAAAIKLADTPICSAEFLCRLPNSTFDEVSEPGRCGRSFGYPGSCRGHEFLLELQAFGEAL